MKKISIFIQVLSVVVLSLFFYSCGSGGGSSSTQEQSKSSASVATDKVTCIVDERYSDGTEDDSICIEKYPRESCLLEDKDNTTVFMLEDNCIALGYPESSLILYENYNLYYKIGLYSNNQESSSSQSSVSSQISSSSSSASAQESIGVNGGRIATKDSYVDIPSNTFTQEQDVRITVSKNTTFDSDKELEEYSLEGIPEDFSQAITIAVKQLDMQSNLLLLRTQTYAKSANVTEDRYSIVEGEVKDGYITYTLEPSTSTENAPKRAVGYFSAGWAALQGYKIFDTKKGHFRIRFPDAWLNEALDLEAHLEDAYSYYENIGFDLSRRTSWPMTINIYAFSSKDTASGYYIQSKPGAFSNNYGYINFNRTYIAEATTMKVTAVHEFFHFVQSLYYPSTLGIKHGDASTWFDEATAVWSEEDFMNNGYTSALLPANLYSVLDKFNNTQDYGYGMSALVKYMVKQTSKHTLVDIYSEYYNKAKDITNNVTANFTTTAILWWPRFIQSYIQGDVHQAVSPIEISTTHAKKAPELNMGLDYKDTVELSDWQTKLYYFPFSKTLSEKLDINMSLKIEGDTSDCTITAFNFDKQTNSLVKIGDRGTEVALENINKLYKKGSRGILIAITNAHIEAPFNTKKEIKFEAKIIGLDFSKLNQVKLLLSIEKVHFLWKKEVVDEDGNPYIVKYESDGLSVPNFWEKADYLICPISYNSGVFTFNCHSDESNYDVALNFKLDSEKNPTKFQSGSLYMSDSEGSSINASYKNIDLDMSNIEVDNDGYVTKLTNKMNNIYGYFNGSSFCNIFQNLDGKYFNGSDGPYELQSYDCSEGGIIFIEMFGDSE
jgi:hypothetical protein